MTFFSAFINLEAAVFFFLCAFRKKAKQANLYIQNSQSYILMLQHNINIMVEQWIENEKQYLVNVRSNICSIDVACECSRTNAVNLITDRKWLPDKKSHFIQWFLPGGPSMSLSSDKAFDIINRSPMTDKNNATMINLCVLTRANHSGNGSGERQSRTLCRLLNQLVLHCTQI